MFYASQPSPGPESVRRTPLFCISLILQHSFSRLDFFCPFLSMSAQGIL